MGTNITKISFVIMSGIFDKKKTRNKK